MSYRTRAHGTPLVPFKGHPRGHQRERRLPLQAIEAAAVASTWELFLRTSSRRVSSFLSVTFQPYGPIVIADYNSSVWTLRAMEETGSGLAPLHVIQSAIALPTAYEFDSSIRIARATLTLNNPDNPTPSSKYGQWFANVRWEVNTPMDEDEAAALLDACSVNASKSA